MPRSDDFTGFFEQIAGSTREAWDRWLALWPAEGAGDWTRKAEKVYLQGLQEAERAVNQGLQMQAEWLKSCRGAMSNGPFAELGEAGLKLADQSLEQRAELWQQWFTLARKADFSPITRIVEQLKPQQEPWAFWQFFAGEVAERPAGVKAVVETAAEVAKTAPAAEAAEAEAKPESAARARAGRPAVARATA